LKKRQTGRVGAVEAEFFNGLLAGSASGKPMRCRRFWRIELDVYIDLLQWPAMVVTVIAAWLIGSLQPGRRFVGFCCFLLSNLLWVIWGWHAEAWALITLQVCLALMNLRGVKKNDAPTQPEPDAPRA
jgi:hypothetical protein